MSLLARLVFEMPGMSMAVSFIGGILGREGMAKISVTRKPCRHFAARFTPRDVAEEET